MHLKALAHLIFVISFDVGCRIAHDANEFGIAAGKCLGDLLLGNLQRIQLDFIKFLGIFVKGSILLRFHICNDGGYCVLYVERVLGTVENFLIRNGVKIINANHSGQSFLCACSFC